MAENLFRRAKRLLDKKDSGARLTEGELRLIHTAIIPLMVKAEGFFLEDMTIGEGLEELAKMVEEQAKNVARERGRAEVSLSGP